MNDTQKPTTGAPYDNGGDLPRGTFASVVAPMSPYGARGPILDAEQEIRVFAAEKAGAILRNVGTVFAKGEALDVLDVIRLAAYIEHGLDYLDIVAPREDDEEEELPVEEPQPSTWQ